MAQRINNLIPGLTALAVSFSVYMVTLAPTVWFIDSGELAAVASTLGIAHPTGYPLFTIIGYLFTKLPVPGTEVYKLNLMSAVFCAAGILIFSKLVSLMLKGAYSPDNKARKTSRDKHPLLPNAAAYGIVIFSSLLLAFSKTYWGSANSVEVYPLHVFFIITLVYLFLTAVLSSGNESSGKNGFLSAYKYYLLFAFILGLSFTNHLTTILLAPACLTLFFAENWKLRKKLVPLTGTMAMCFAAGLSLYLYLPVRANMNPAFNWGNPYNLERFYWHITGKQFSVWIFSAKGSLFVFFFLIAFIIAVSAAGLAKKKSLSRRSHLLFPAIAAGLTFLLLGSGTDIVSTQFSKFTSSLWTEFGTGLAVLAVFGVYRMSGSDLRFYYFTILAFLSCVIYSVNYDIHDIYSYFLLAYIIIAVWIGFGMLFIFETAVSRLKTKVQAAAFDIIIILLCAVALNSNYSSNNESGNYYIEEFTMNIFRNAEPNSIIISSQWDFWVSASWYYVFVKKMRPDIVVIDKELLRRSWYLQFLERVYPEVYLNSKPEIERFMAELYKFEHGIPYDQVTISKAFSDMLTSFVTKNPGRNVYTTWEIEQNRAETFAAEYVRIPDGMLYRLVNPGSLRNGIVEDYKLYDFSFTPITKTDYYHETLTMSYAMMLTNSAGYLLLKANRVPDARKYVELALIAKPNFQPAIELRKKLNF